MLTCILVAWQLLAVCAHFTSVMETSQHTAMVKCHIAKHTNNSFLQHQLAVCGTVFRERDMSHDALLPSVKQDCWQVVINLCAKGAVACFLEWNLLMITIQGSQQLLKQNMSSSGKL